MAWTPIGRQVVYQKFDSYHVVKVTNTSPSHGILSPAIEPFVTPRKANLIDREPYHLETIATVHAPKTNVDGLGLCAAVNGTFFNNSAGSWSVYGPVAGPAPAGMLERGTLHPTLSSTRRSYFGRQGATKADGGRPYLIGNVETTPDHTSDYLLNLATPVEYFMGGGGILLKGGVLGDSAMLAPNWLTQELKGQADAKNARTAVGLSSTAVLLVVVLMQAKLSSAQLADFMQAQLGVTDAVFFDGGHSSQMWVNSVAFDQTVEKDPKFDDFRPLSSALLVYSSPLGA